MKNKFLSILILPMLLLTSCGKGQKISEDKAKELAKQISEYTEQEQEVKPMIITIDVKGEEGRGNEKESSDVHYELSTDKNENTKFKVKGDDGEESFDYVIYIVKDEKYEEVSYIKDYDASKKTYNEYVYTKKDNPEYDTAVSVYSIQLLLPILMLAQFSDPVTLMESEDFQNGEREEDGITYKTDVAYYSNGEKNLTIESTTEYVSGTLPEDEEEVIKTSYSVTYNNLMLKKAKMVSKSNYDNSAELKLNIDFKSVKVELPDNWESLINK